MKILQLRTENIKNLKVVEISPTSGEVILSGKNEAGKSAVLDSIYIALTGQKLDQPIRKGQERAQVDLDLGDYKIRRVITAKTDRLEVMSKDGAKYSSPQDLLNKLIGKISFDPLSFAMAKPTTQGLAEQRKVIMELSGLDFTVLDLQRKGKYDERSIINRELDVLTKSIGIDPGIDGEEKSFGDELLKIDALESEKKAHEDYEKEQADIAKEINDVESRIIELTEQIHAERVKYEALQEKQSKLVEPKVVTEEEIATARAALKDIESHNAAVRAKKTWLDKNQQRITKQSESERLAKEIEALDQEKNNKIKTAQYPISGLTVDEEKVLYNGLPLSQLSTGAKIKVSTAIAMALNPKLKVIFVRDGSLLDKAGMQSILDMAKEKDYQIWMEYTKDEKGVGIYLEDGEVK